MHILPAVAWVREYYTREHGERAASFGGCPALPSNHTSQGARGAAGSRPDRCPPDLVLSLSLSWKRTTAFREQFLPVRATRMGQPIMALLPWGRGQPANDLSAAPLPCEPHLVGALARSVT